MQLVYSARITNLAAGNPSAVAVRVTGACLILRLQHRQTQSIKSLVFGGLERLHAGLQSIIGGDHIACAAGAEPYEVVGVRNRFALPHRPRSSLFI